MSKLPTLQDEYDKDASKVIDKIDKKNHDPAFPYTRCKCGRRVSFDMMVDIRPIISDPRDYVCDGCYARLKARGLTSDGLLDAHDKWNKKPK